MPISSDLASIEHTAVRLDLTTDLVRKLVKQGILPAVRVSERNLKIPVAAVDRYIAAGGVPRETRARRTKRAMATGAAS